ncbi:MAG: SET domain-containing protein-lysine N-methyltransferase [Saprospiraceae bacterium]
MKTQPYHIVRNSKIHGKGVFAKRPIRKGVKVIEYTGDIISVKKADKIGVQQDGKGHSHTMLFTVDDKRVINGNTGGDAKFINHSCDPNCEAVQYGDKVFIESLRAIPQGQELTYDYHLVVDGKITEEVKKEFACFCGSPSCRGTQIDAKIVAKSEKKEEKKKHKEAKEKAKKASKKAKETAKKAKMKLKDESKKAKENAGKSKKIKSSDGKQIKKLNPTSDSPETKEKKKKKGKKKK